jgi:sucrose phosphorylase
MEHARVHTLLSTLYGLETADSVFPDLIAIIDQYRNGIPLPRRGSLDQRDTLLITYADQVQEPGKRPLQTLEEFCRSHLSGVVSGVHVLPFYPWSSDDGFSVIDYEKVAPQYGTWEDIRRLGEKFRLMVDAVINHASAESEWFKGYQRGDAQYEDFFIEVKGNPDLSEVVRPRALPLLTEFRVQGELRRIWTTFSADQVDLNYQNPKVLLRMLQILLGYVSQGAEFIRLDAIAYLWKQPGTKCISLPQTHAVVQLMRAVLDEVAGNVRLITETNVPSIENLTYFGDGSNEAQLVYNFPLPPLVLHTLQTGNADTLARWARQLKLPSRQVTFLNFLASHDGIGLNPVRGILKESEIEALSERTGKGGGFLSTKTNANGTQSAYELNINYFDALDCGESKVEEALQVRRFLTAHAILLAFEGVPAIYFHSMFGSRGWRAGVDQTGKQRAINREKLEREMLERELAEAGSLRAQIFEGMTRMLQVRAGQSAFAPQATQRVLLSPPGVLALLRGDALLCVYNVRAEACSVELDVSGMPLERAGGLQELISGRELPAGDPLELRLEPYESAWLTYRD